MPKAHPDGAFASDMFPPTMWSRVRLAVAEGKPGADQALNDLCKAYQTPILAYIIRDGCAPDEAEDLKQAFFEHLLSRNAFADAETTRVKLRAFLVTKLQSFLVDKHRHATAQKRGAGHVVPLSTISEEQRHLAEPVDHVTPFVVYQRLWMETLIGAAMKRLLAEYSRGGQDAYFAAISPFITSSSGHSIATLSERFGRPPGTVKSDISRLRAKCQKLIRDQIAATLMDPTPDNIDTELKDLMGYRA